MGHAAISVAINGQVFQTGTCDSDILVHEQLAAAEYDGAGDCESNRVVVICEDKRLTQRADSVVVSVCYGDRCCASGNCDGAKDNGPPCQRLKTEKASEPSCSHFLL